MLCSHNPIVLAISHGTVLLVYLHGKKRIILELFLKMDYLRAVLHVDGGDLLFDVFMSCGNLLFRLGGLLYWEGADRGRMAVFRPKSEPFWWSSGALIDFHTFPNRCIRRGEIGTSIFNGTLGAVWTILWATRAYRFRTRCPWVSTSGIPSTKVLPSSIFSLIGEKDDARVISHGSSATEFLDSFSLAWLSIVKTSSQHVSSVIATKLELIEVMRPAFGLIFTIKPPIRDILKMMFMEWFGTMRELAFF